MTHTPAQSDYADVAGATTRYVTVESKSEQARYDALAARAAWLMRKGADPQRIAFVVTRACEVAPVRKKLARAAGPAANDVRVLTAAQVALDVIDSPQASAELQRAPRLLTHFEELFLNEDVKTLGTQPKRLREMLKFLYKGLAELADRDVEWLITLEEKTVLGKVRSFLTECGAVLPCEAANLALAHLEAASQCVPYEHVLASDWTALNKASQALLDACARTSLAVAGWADDPGVDTEPYANPKGLADLAQAHPGNVTHVTIASACGANTQLLPVVWENPRAEVTGIASWLAKRVAAGDDAGSYGLVAPNRVWARRLQEACEREGVTTTVLPGKKLLAGDPRKLEQSRGMAAFALLGLAANKKDLLAWRTWIGLGDCLLASNAWQGLQQSCADQSVDVVSGLLGLSVALGEPFAGAQKLTARVSQAQVALRELEGLTGSELAVRVCELTGADAGELAELLGRIDAGEQAASLYARLRNQVVDPVFMTSEATVRIGPDEAFIGAHTPVLVLTGLVDGFTPGPECFDDRLPPDFKERNLARARSAFDRTLGSAGDRAVLSRFDHEWLVDAEPARMEIKRIRATREGRLATIRPSTFVLERSNALPNEVDTLT